MNEGKESMPYNFSRKFCDLLRSEDKVGGSFAIFPMYNADVLKDWKAKRTDKRTKEGKISTMILFSTSRSELLFCTYFVLVVL